MNVAATTVFVLLFAGITVLGFAARRWNRGDLRLLSEWGLGGRRFGGVITWFLLGGDIYTAYTFVAVPALMFGAGATGFFSVLTMMLVYPIMFAVMPRLWTVARAHNYLTAADFVRGRFGSPTLALAVAVTGIAASIPYIALQLVGLEVVIAGLGLHFPIVLGGITVELPLLIAFAILAGYTYANGLHATAMIAIVKDVLIYGTVIAAIIVIPSRLGGYAHIFASVEPHKLFLDSPGAQSGYASLALGSALALFLYPHNMTGILSAGSRETIRRNAVAMPLYTFALGLIALLGFMALTTGVRAMPQYAQGFAHFGSNFAVPALFLHMFPGWFAGVAFAAIGIGALVPAAIMSIAAANLFTRNIYREYVRPDATDLQECRVARRGALIVKLAALLFVLGFPQVYAVQMQLLGGIWIIQTLPAVMLGLFTNRLHPSALLAGWATGLAAGTAMAVSLKFATSVYPIHVFGLVIPCYAAVSGLALNLLVSGTLSLLFKRTSADATSPQDYA